MTTIDVEQLTAAGYGATPETEAELIAQAEAIAETLVDRQAETEDRTFYAPDTHEALKESGLYRLLVPKAYGGYEVSIKTFMKIASIIARGCPSTGWCFTLSTGNTLPLATFFPKAAQDAIFAEGDLICPTTQSPQAKAHRDGSDWIIDGDFNFCSGAPYGQFFMGHVLPDDSELTEPILFFAPRSEWKRLDDWGNQIGLKGSGSHSIRFDGGRVPAAYTMLNTTMMSFSPKGGTIGKQLHGNPMYAGSCFSFFMMQGTAVAVGIAHGALDAYAKLMTTKTIVAPPYRKRTEDPDYQRWYGTAVGKIATAEAALADCCEQWAELARTDGFDPEADMRLVGIAKEAIGLCWDAVQGVLARTAGSTAMRTGERIERAYRDLSTVHAHNGFVAFGEFATRAVATAHFGI
jgi:3-hydroxy-9,10-secoandrosta-1,3,5(10)-triene-9,17-dione monooxygenase